MILEKHFEFPISKLKTGFNAVELQNSLTHPNKS